MTNGTNQRVYYRAESVVFLKTREAFGGLSNMAGGYPLLVNGIRIPSSEALYQACRFPHLPDVQRLIIGQTSPMTAKMKGKPYREHSRADWNMVRVPIMRWCLRVKLAQNWETFGPLLLSTEDKPIVEESRRDPFWGAMPIDEETLIGVNALGRLLMELRGLLRNPGAEALQTVPPLKIADFVLLGKPIETIDPFHRRRLREAPESYNLTFDTESHTASEVKNDELSQILLFQSTLDTLLNEPFLPDDGAAVARPLISVPDYLMAADDFDTEEPAVENGATYPRRLIEVDLPIKRISAHARREKSIRHGHISTLHIWWARRPLAACRAVICAALWPDPADEQCPPAFRRVAAHVLAQFAELVRGDAALAALCKESWSRWKRTNEGTLRANDPACWPELRYALLDFIADFANWDASTVPAFLETARALTQAAHEALGGEPGTRPLVVDPFAGGGAIPLEALRVGADAFASDLNPVAVLLNKVVLEYIPRYGQRLADEVRKWGQWVKEQAEKELAEFYPKDPDGATPIAYLWARTITCEGPGCGAEVPLIRSTTLTKKRPKSYIQITTGPHGKILVNLCDGVESHSTATVRQGSATCPKCNYTMPEKRVKAQLIKQEGGSNNAYLFAVLTNNSGERGFRKPNKNDMNTIERVKKAHQELVVQSSQFIPYEPINPIRPYKNTVGVCIVTRIGINRFSDLYTHRQILSLTTFQRIIRSIEFNNNDNEIMGVVSMILNLALDRLVMQNTSLSRWNTARSTIEGLFSKQALQIVWDFAEANPIGFGPANWEGAISWIEKAIVSNLDLSHQGTAVHSDASHCPLPDNSIDFVFTDPPYFAAVPYADLSDVFYVWLKRGLNNPYSILFQEDLVKKQSELIVTNSSPGPNGEIKDASFFSSGMTRALDRARVLTKPSGISCIVFADSSTTSWESMLSAVIDGGWIVVASWPIDTEMQNRTRAQNSASLQSSIFMLCRPREMPDGKHNENVGEWRDLLAELPIRIHEWMPRLANEGVVGADAIFACLGPALEVFSRYSRVEKASGEQVFLREYLEQVWAAVAREALSLLFKDADAGGLEPDARLTAMWLWTLSTTDDRRPTTGNGEADDAVEEDDEEGGKKNGSKGGFSLEFDAARKIAQGLGANLDSLRHVVEVKGETARLLPVGERTRYLFGKDEAQAPAGRRPKKSAQQLSMFAELEQADHDTGWGEKSAPKPGATVLDRVHQAMILFAAGRAEAMKRFLVEEGAGNDARFWKLAQSLSALYPAGTDEKRWVDGVLARKKGLGF